MVLGIYDGKLSFGASCPSGQPTLRGMNGTSGVGAEAFCVAALSRRLRRAARAAPSPIRSG